jgi:hypothetical protein
MEKSTVVFVCQRNVVQGPMVSFVYTDYFCFFFSLYFFLEIFIFDANAQQKDTFLLEKKSRLLYM